MKTFLRILGLGLIILIAVHVVNTWRYSPQFTASEPVTLPDVAADAVAARLGEAIRIKTLSTRLGLSDDHPDFLSFVDWLAATYPAANAAIDREMINGLTPLYHWPGSDPSLPPILLTAHYDVVPAVERDGNWAYPPFSGEIAEGFIWGRGALDDKSAVVALMEAVELLAGQGFRPARTVYLSFGHDEEIGGRMGAGGVAEYFQAKGTRMAWSLDEGSMILKDVIAGLDYPVASINVAEKGYVTLDITAHAEGGHSSLPPRDTAVSTLAAAVTRLQSEPVPGGLTGASRDFFDALGPYFSLEKRVLFANQWLWRPVLEMVLSGSPATDAMLRSTKAPTMLAGSAKENVLPQQAVATVNYRIHPRDSIETIVQHTRDMIGDDAVDVSIRGKGNEPSEVSVSDSAAFGLLAATFRQVFGDLIVVPGLTVAGTDTRHYSKISDNSYRINPFVFTGEDIARLHGANERIGVDAMAQAVQFYVLLIRNAAG